MPKRNHIIHAAVTEDEFESLRGIAFECRVTMSTLIRDIVTNPLFLKTVERKSSNRTHSATSRQPSLPGISKAPHAAPSGR